MPPNRQEGAAQNKTKMQRRTRQCATILLLCILALLHCKQHTLVVSAVSQSFTDAIDAATSDYITTDAWTNTLTNLGLIYFAVPTCSPKPTYPTKFDFKKVNMTLCYEQSPGIVWEKLHEKAGNLLVSTLNQKYGLKIGANIIQLDTSALGYFSTLATATNNGTCDVAIASTNYDSVRATQVHFQCRYGGSSKVCYFYSRPKC